VCWSSFFSHSAGVYLFIAHELLFLHLKFRKEYVVLQRSTISYPMVVGFVSKLIALCLQEERYEQRGKAAALPTSMVRSSFLEVLRFVR